MQIGEKVASARKKLKISHGFVLAACDIVFLAAAYYLAYLIRFYTDFFEPVAISYTFDPYYLSYSGIYVAISLAVLFSAKLYSLDSAYSGPKKYIRMVLGTAISMALLVAYGNLVHGFSFSRIWLAFLFVFSIILVPVGRNVAGFLSRRALEAMADPPRPLLIGFGQDFRAAANMPRRTKKFWYGLFLVVNDIIFLTFSFYIAYYIRFFRGFFRPVDISYTLDQNYVFYSVIFIVTNILIFFIFKLYNWDSIYRGSGYYWRIIKGFAINLVLVILIGYLFEQFTFSRIWLLIMFLLGIFTLCASRFIIEVVSQAAMNHLRVTPKTIIVGIGENGKRIEDTFSRRAFWGYEILGYVDSRNRIESNPRYSSEFNILGSIEEIGEVVKEHNVQRIIVCGLEYNYSEILDIVERLKSFDISTLIFPGFFEFSIRRMEMREISGIPLIQVANIGFFGFNLFLKNIIDYILGILIFILFIPIYLVVGLMIKADSPGPVFYKQKRYTKDCKEFYIYKFRTMYVDADKKLEELKAKNEADGPMFKIKNDPRITRTGRFLRKFSIDEVPQIINVLKGELSLVGPRPPLPWEVAEYDDWVKKRLNVKQGITGLWQISGRSELNFEEMARLDLYYIQNWSPGLDINIILKTIPAVIFSRGAY